MAASPIKQLQQIVQFLEYDLDLTVESVIQAIIDPPKQTECICSEDWKSGTVDAVKRLGHNHACVYLEVKQGEPLIFVVTYSR